MKKLNNKITFALICLMTSVPAFADVTVGSGVCELITNLQGIFKILRTLAFVGAAFYIANWAWGYISKPGDLKIEDVKDKGIGLMVGFILLFIIGAILSFVLSASGQHTLGCDITQGWD
ncbi:MAG: hypothetical protein MJ158_02205 [Alphaproteobacteria bacterium]|nr:hypothetical protein [Alphaproteobacteria bacterium]